MMNIIKFTRNLMAVAGLVLIILGVYLIMSGNIEITKRTEDHNVTVTRDGKVTNYYDWTELLGYDFSINIKDSTYIGK